MQNKLDVSTVNFKVKTFISNTLNNQFEGYGEMNGFGKNFNDIWELLSQALDPKNAWYVSIQNSMVPFEIDLTRLPLSFKQELVNFMDKHAIATVSEAVVILATAFFDAREQDQHSVLIDKTLGLLAGYLQSSQPKPHDCTSENLPSHNAILERLEALEKRLDSFTLQPALQHQETPTEKQLLPEPTCGELNELRSRIKDLLNATKLKTE